MDEIREELESLRDQVRRVSDRVDQIKEVTRLQHLRCDHVEKVVQEMETKDAIAEAVAIRLRADRTMRFTTMQRLFAVITVLCAVGGFALGIHAAL